MSWRTIVVTKHSHLSFKNEYMIIRNEEVVTIHLNEISVVIIDSLQVSLTAYLISELVKRKIGIIYCDEKHLPLAHTLGLHNAHNSSKKIGQQINWDRDFCGEVWKEVIKQKIRNQAKVLEPIHKEKSEYILEVSQEVVSKDSTNKEGLAAKIYFEHLFLDYFNRSEDDDRNSALNYGYAILLSAVSKAIVAKGYLTQIGIKHVNEFNHHNLASDLMEVFRPIVDEYVIKNQHTVFDGKYKLELINLLNSKVKVNDEIHYVNDGIGIFVYSVFNAIQHNDLSLIANVSLI
ncbi:MAG: type II CRISPR-associated endonuclease Cas1 [Erysipelotrichaceae bacterium]